MYEVRIGLRDQDSPDKDYLPIFTTFAFDDLASAEKFVNMVSNFALTLYNTTKKVGSN